MTSSVPDVLLSMRILRSRSYIFNYVSPVFYCEKLCFEDQDDQNHGKSVQKQYLRTLQMGIKYRPRNVISDTISEKVGKWQH